MEKTLPPEIELLLCCARTALPPQVVARIKTLVGAGLNWQTLQNAADYHHVYPLLYWHLNAVCPDQVPPAVLDNLREKFHQNNECNLFLVQELLRLLRRFESNNLPVIVFKGPILATAVYGNFALRPFLDLDLLVSPSHVPKARELLISSGYNIQRGFDLAREPTVLRTGSEYGFWRADHKALVDLHWRVMPDCFSMPFDFERLWQSRQVVMLGGTSVSTFSPEDLALFLCAHGAKHTWERIEWIASLAELTRAHQATLDWDRIRREAVRLHVERMFLLGLRLANDLLQPPLPEEILHQVKGDPAISELSAQVITWLTQMEFQIVGLAERTIFQIRAREHLSDRLRHLFLVLTVPSLGDWELVPLPQWLAPFYRLIHLIRILGKYGIRSLKLLR